MSIRVSEQPSTDGPRGQDEATLAQMDRYELARCRSARDLLFACGGIASEPTTDREIDAPCLLADQSIASPTVRAAEKTRLLVRFVIAACRWAYERVAL